jgi:hypothetical protein
MQVQNAIIERQRILEVCLVMLAAQLTSRQKID